MRDESIAAVAARHRSKPALVFGGGLLTCGLVVMAVSVQLADGVLCSVLTAVGFMAVVCGTAALAWALSWG